MHVFALKKKKYYEFFYVMNMKVSKFFFFENQINFKIYIVIIAFFRTHNKIKLFIRSYFCYKHIQTFFPF